MKIKLLIPVYNDWQSVIKLLEIINSEVSGLSYEFSVIIVNDASTEKKPEMSISLDNLNSYLESACPEVEKINSYKQFKGGQSNPTYLLTAESQKYVLRRKPPGKLLKSAHAVDREYKVITALEHTPVPTPKTYHLCENPEIIGTDFYIMEYCDGVIDWDPVASEASI